MLKKKSKTFIVSSVLVVFALALAACQPMIASNEAESRQKAIDAWAANYTAQLDKYYEELAETSVPLVELESDVPAGMDQMIDAFLPGISVSQTRLVSGDFMTEYVVKSAGPGWVVFHEDDNGEPGKILRYIYVDGGTSTLVNIESEEEMSTETMHVMLHEDNGTIGRFEFPGEDGPVFVDEEIVNEMCLCNY